MKVKPIVARNAIELAAVLGLSPVDGLEMEFRCQLNDKIIDAARESGLTHAQLAKAAGTSRSRLTAIFNRNRSHVSTDLMTRILASPVTLPSPGVSAARKIGAKFKWKAVE